MQPFSRLENILNDLEYGLKFLGVIFSEPIAIIDRLFFDSLVNGRLSTKMTGMVEEETGDKMPCEVCKGSTATAVSHNHAQCFSNVTGRTMSNLVKFCAPLRLY